MLDVRCVVLGSALFFAGCAAPAVIIDGHPVPRQRIELKGNPYAIRHIDAHPRPGGPSSGLKAQGGRITGVVCGTDIEYSVEHTGDFIELTGVLDNQLQSRLRIVEGNDGVRGIAGNVATREVKIQFSKDWLSGSVGRCPHEFASQADAGDALLAHVTGRGQKMTVRLNGAKELWQMPAADQAAVLPLMLLCMDEKIFDNLGRADAPELGFGGSGGAVPTGTLQFVSGSMGQRDCGADSYR